MKKQMMVGAKILWHIFASCLLLALIGAGLLAWRLSSGPIDLTAALPYIEDALNTQNTDLDFDIETLSLDWENTDNLIGLKAGKVIISNRRGPFLYTPEVNLNLSMRYLFLGQFKIEDVWIPRISLSLTRQRDGHIHITGLGSASAEHAQENGVPAVVTLNNLLYDLPVLNTFRIDEARVTYRDRVLDKTRVFDPVSAYVDVDIALNGERSMSGYFTLPFDGEKHSNVRLDFSTTNNPLAIHVKGQVFDTNIKNLLQFTSGLPAGWDIDMTTTADIGLTMDDAWSLTSFTFNGVADAGRLTFPMPSEKQDNVTLKNIDVSMTKDETGDALRIDNLSALVDDTAAISLTGMVLHPADMGQIAGDVEISVDRLPQAWFPRFWPQGDHDLLVREWLVNRIGHGEYKDLTGRVVFDMAAFSHEDDDAQDEGLPDWLPTVDVRFAYEDMTVDYNEPMVPADKVKGTGHYKDVALALNIESADVGGLTVTGGTLNFDDLVTSGQGTATLRLPISGDVGAVFNYIEKDPINALDKIDLDVKQAKGNAKLLAEVSFPLVADMATEDIKVDVTGVLSDIDFPNVLRGLNLSGGPFDVAVTADDFKMSGAGRLQGQPISIEWHEFFEKPQDHDYLSLIEAKLTANDAIRRAFMKDKADYFAGMIGTELVYKQDADGGRAKVDLNLDMQGAAINLPDFGIQKRNGEASTASLNLNLRDGNLQSINGLSIKGKTLSVNNAQMGFRTVQGEPALQSMDMPDLKFGDNDLSVKVGTQDNFMKIALSGRFLDARPILQSEKDSAKAKAKSSPQPYEVGIDVDEMRTSDKATIKNVKAYAKANNQSQIERFELDAVAGKGALYVRYTPMADERLSLQVEADDAGATLRAFDLYPNIVGGRLRIGGRPLQGGRFGDVKGKARIDDFTVWNAPVLVRLVNALSLPGILGLLEQQQLGFARLEADFEWRLDPAGDLYLVENGTTSGASLGLTFEGTVDTKQNEMTIRGTAAPLSGINKMIGQIPVIGNILTGGDNGAVVAATYVMRGPTDDPQVSVNPLSILTPGILRRMLFENNSAQQSAD